MNHSFRTFLAVASVLVLASFSLAAQRQCVIIDAFTQWNCGPCAGWNPTERAVLHPMTRDTVISIKTHVSWPQPNNDAFHLYNVTDANARRGYYGVNSVPAGFCDGVISFGQSASVLRNSIRSRYSTPSPCTIDNLRAFTDFGQSTVNVVGTITAEQTLSNASLYVVLILNEVTYPTSPGSNGETYFPDIFCDAVPNFNTGTLVNASPGNPYSFDVTIPRMASWDPRNISAVVFLQNNTSREVLQGEWARMTLPYEFEASNADPVQEMTEVSGGERIYMIPVDNTGTMNDTYTATLTGVEWPAGWSYSIEEVGGVSDPSSVTFSIHSFESTFLAVRVNPNGTPGSAQFGVHIQSAAFEEFTADFGWRLMAGLDVLVIDADGGSDYETYYAEALAAVDNDLGVVWGWWDSSLDAVDYSMFDGIDALIWFTGDLWSEALSMIDQQNIQNYLDAGGRLLITGQGLGFDMRTDPLFTDYMHATWLRNFPIGISVTGIEGTAGSGLSFGVAGGDGANNQTRQASIEARDAMATLIFNYDQDRQGVLQGSGLTVDNGVYRLMFLAFGFEAIADAANRAAMMSSALNWLATGVVSTPEAPAALPKEFSLLQNYPNPFNPDTNIPFALPVRSQVKLSVFDLLGREVATLADGPFDAGTHVVNWNASELSSGVYFYRLDAQGGQQNFNSTRKVVLMK